MIGYYKLVGKKAVPCTLTEWSIMVSQDPSNRVVRRDDEPGILISTVFLGMDHSFQENGPPLIFETMIFADNNSKDGWCERASTWEEAEENHQKALVEIVKK